MLNQEGVRVLNVDQAQAYLNLHDVAANNYDNYLRTNSCFLYYLPSDEVVLLPADYSDKELKGIIFKNKAALEKCLSDDHFPVENKSHDPVVFNQQYVRHIDKEINGIIKTLKELVSHKEVDSVTNLSLSALLLTLREQKLSKQELFFAALALGEYVRRVNHGHWIILKKYGTYNPYYVPALIYTGNKIFLLWDFLVTFFKGSIVTPETYAALPYIKDPGLVLNNAFFKNNYWGYENLEDGAK